MAFIDMWGDWLWFAGIAFGLTTTLVATVYMLSELLQNDKMKGWAKMELTEILYSAVIIGMAMVALPVIDGVVQGALGVSNSGSGTTTTFIATSDYGLFTNQAPQIIDICGAAIADSNISVYHGVESCHVRLGIWYMREIFNEAKKFAFDTYIDYIGTSMISEFTINIEFLFEQAGFFTFTPWKGFYTMGNKIKEMTFDWAIKLMMLVKFQEVMLRFIAVSLFPALFIIGVFLRTFAFTRRIGGLLLGMAIALYFVFPAFYAFGALIVLNLRNDPAIRNAWINDAVANPAGANNPIPPIADTMYVAGLNPVPMPGGNGSFYTAQDVGNSLRQYEGMTPAQYFQAMEQGHTQSGDALMPAYNPNTGRIADLTSTAHQNDSETAINDTLRQQRAAADSWFGNISRQNKFDNYVSSAWSANGPVESLSRITFWAVFFSLFGILATIAAIRSLSITFGGDIEIAGLTRLI